MQEIFFAKTTSLVITAGALFFLSAPLVLILFIVLGHAHFFAAYLYQWKAGKITSRYILFYFLGLTVLLGAVLFSGRIDILIVATALIFLIHFLLDEVTLFGHAHSRYTTLGGVPIFLLYAGFIIDVVFQTNTLPVFAPLGGVALVIFLGLQYLKKNVSLSLVLYFVGGAGILFALFALGISIPLAKLIGAIIIFHYVNWYVYYYFRVRKKREAKAFYLSSMLAINVIVIALYLLFSRDALTFTGISALGFLFAPTYFYIWTLMHIATSVRLRDVRQALL